MKPKNFLLFYRNHLADLSFLYQIVTKRAVNVKTDNDSGRWRLLQSSLKNSLKSRFNETDKKWLVPHILLRYE